MTQASIYEQRKGKGWLLASWGEYTCLTSFGDEVAVSYLERVFYRLMDQLKIEGLQVHVVQLVSDWEFILFVLDCLSQKTNRSLTAHRHKGCILIEEEGQLVYIHLPKQGVPLVDFLGTDSESSQLGEVVLIATRNAGKTREFQRFFEPLGYRVENLTDYPDLPEVAETGVTFEENARLKAETIAKLTGKMILADDSGLKVDALGGLPGVWSARFSGPDATDARNNAKLLHELATVFELKDRTAQFHCTLVLAAPGMESLVVSAEWGGRIAFSPQGEQGFGYDPLFLVGEGSLTAAELSLEEKNAQSHRARALEQLMEEFPAWQHLTHS